MNISISNLEKLFIDSKTVIIVCNQKQIDTICTPDERAVTVDVHDPDYKPKSRVMTISVPSGSKFYLIPDDEENITELIKSINQ